MDSVPRSSSSNSAEIPLMFYASRSSFRVCRMTLSPGGVILVRVRPRRTKILNPSSSSRSLSCLLTAGCVVHSFAAAAVYSDRSARRPRENAVAVSSLPPSLGQTR
jgi:hypothetical protein